MVIGKTSIASPHDSASHGEAGITLSALAPLLEVSLVLLSGALALSEAEVSSLSIFIVLAPSGAFVLSSRLKDTLALLSSAFDLSKDEVASLSAFVALALSGAFTLASWEK